MSGAYAAGLRKYDRERRERGTPDLGIVLGRVRAKEFIEGLPRKAWAVSYRSFLSGWRAGMKQKANPPKGFIPCKAVKITRNRGRVEVRVRR